MLFNTIPFLIFFIVFFILYYFVFVRHSQRLWLIALASLFFYGTWNYKYIPLLLATGITDFYLARWIHDERREQRRKTLLTLSVVMNLGALALFKYLGLFLVTTQSVLRVMGAHIHVPTVNIVVPLGISFYVFQSLSYTIDVYRGVFAPRRRIHEFIASLTFFPHLIAGPIVRSSYLLPQFESFVAPEWTTMKRGFLLLAAGLFKKTIADLLSVPADALFAAKGPHGFIDSWTGALAFTAQLYGDFSGYTDIAIGLSLLLGFELPANFNLPFLASSIADFWRRWHITLATWLRDYLYTPLALTNRRHPYMNVIITMTLAGLWHGPQWTFVAFGLYHGVLLACTSWVTNHAPLSWYRLEDHQLFRVGRVIFTFYLVVLGNVVFRASSFASAFAVLRGMHRPVLSQAAPHQALASLLFVGSALFICHFVDYLIIHNPKLTERRWVLWPAAALGMAFSMLFGQPGIAFIYFQF